MAKKPSKPSSNLVRENAEIMTEAARLYNRINAHWATAEQKLQELGILKPFTVHIHTDDLGEESSLSVVKHGGKWRIFLVTSLVQDTDGSHCKATLITDCPLETRVEFLEYLPAIFDGLLESNRKAVEDLREAAVKSDQLFLQLDIDSI